MNQRFVKNLIKGKIAEIIFEQMFRESDEYTVLRSGYEYTLPELAQYQHLAEVKTVIENIRNAPDFILISRDKKNVYIVEVKYRSNKKSGDIKKIAEKVLRNWSQSWLFVASSDGFFFEQSEEVFNNNGRIDSLAFEWVKSPIQKAYLKLLNLFEPQG